MAAGRTQDEVGFENLARLYLAIEGSTTFLKLIDEIQLIEENNDWSIFETRAKDFGISDLDTDKLKAMAGVAIRVFKENIN
jgi:hypothetical protein